MEVFVILLKYLLLQMKNQVFHLKNTVFGWKNFSMKNLVFQIKNFEILGFLHIEFEILGNSTEIPNIQKRCEILGFKGTLCVSSDIGFRR